MLLHPASAVSSSRPEAGLCGPCGDQRPTPDGNSEKMKITLKTLQQQTFAVDIDPTLTVSHDMASNAAVGPNVNSLRY